MVEEDSCPDAQRLQQFLLGKLPGAERKRLARHVEGCERCVRLLDGLHAEDPLVQALRSHVPALAEMQTDAVADLIGRISRLRQSAAPRPRPPDNVPTLRCVPARKPAGRSASSAAEEYPFLAPAQEPDEVGRLGPYRVLKMLGAGGMGVVFLAEDPHLRRPVALKVMKAELAASASGRERFLREARSAAAVKHDHVVTIYQVGEDCGVPYLAMELMGGEPLDTRLEREGKLPVGEVLRIGREIAEGLAAAHARDLIHRDIKPGNIWLEELPGGRGTGAPRSRVKILDFGLARAVADVELTQVGITVGTPAYMAPEQGQGGPVDHRADLFSLGCVLYRMATGKQPFEGAHTTSAFMAGGLRRPRPAHELEPALPPALSGLVMRLLARDREGRPASAGAVADALAAIERAGAAREGAVGPPQPPQRYSRRALLVTAGLLATLGVAASLLAFTVTRVAIDEGKGQLVITTDDPGVEVRVEQNGVTVIDRTGEREIDLKPGDYEIELAEPRAGVRLSTGRFTIERGGRTAVSVTPESAPTPPYQVIPVRWVKYIDSMAWSPDGRYLVTGGGAGGNWNLVNWDVGKRVPVAYPAGFDDQRVLGLTYSPDGRWLAMPPDQNKTAWLWDMPGARGAPVPLKGHLYRGQGVAFSPDSHTLATGCGDGKDGEIRLWDLTQAPPRPRVWPVPMNPVQGVAFTPDGKFLASTHSGDGTVRVWDVKTGKERSVLRIHKRIQPCRIDMAFAPDSKTVAVVPAFSPGEIRVWSVPEGKLLKTWPTNVPEALWMSPASLAPDGRTLALIASEYPGSNKVWLFDMTTGKYRELALPTDDGLVCAATAYAPDGKTLAVAGSDPAVTPGKCKVYLWPVEALGKQPLPETE